MHYPSSLLFFLGLGQSLIQPQQIEWIRPVIDEGNINSLSFSADGHGCLDSSLWISDKIYILAHFTSIDQVVTPNPY